jgi:hypothetical protein
MYRAIDECGAGVAAALSSRGDLAASAMLPARMASGRLTVPTAND